MNDLQVFLPFFALAFYFLDSILWSTKVFNFDEMKFICFFFDCLCFRCQIEESLTNPTSWRLAHVFSWRNFLDLWSTFVSKFRFGCSVQFSSVQSLSHVRLLATPWITARQASLSITNSRSSFKLTSIESVMPSSHLILCRPLLLLPAIPPSIRVFSNESTVRMRWPKYWSFSFSIISSKEHPGLIYFRMYWLDFLAVQGTLRSLP